MKYGKDYWSSKDPDGVLRNRENEKELFLEDAKEEIAYINKMYPGIVLDIGCGLGFFLSALNSRWSKYGIDISTYACNYASNEVENGVITCSDFLDNRYPSHFFDVVIMYHSIEHMEFPVRSLMEVKRIIKPNGTLVITTPNFDCFVARRFKKNFRLLHDKTHISLLKKNTLKLYLELNNFTIDKIKKPFFKTRHFTFKNIIRLLDTKKISPPFYGNIMTFYCHSCKVK